MRRVIRGVDKFVIKAKTPYIVQWTVTNTCVRRLSRQKTAGRLRKTLFSPAGGESTRFRFPPRGLIQRFEKINGWTVAE